jgi:hypothetical protein
VTDRTVPDRQRLLPWLYAIAFATTALVAVTTLLTRSYNVSSCFSQGAMSGCGTRVHPFSVDALPALVWPAAMFAALLIFAAIAWRVDTVTRTAAASIAYIALASEAALMVTPVLIIPIALIALAVLVRTGRELTRALADIFVAAVLVGLAFAVSYEILVFAMLQRGGWLGGVGLPMWIYLAFSSAVGVAVGIGIVVRSRGQRFPLTRGMLAALVVSGIAGTVSLAFLRGDVKSAAFTTVPMIAAIALPLGAAMLERVVPLRRAEAMWAAFAIGVVFPVYVIVLIGTMSSFSYVASIGPDLPRVPWLPGTSTAP